MSSSRSAASSAAKASPEDMPIAAPIQPPTVDGLLRGLAGVSLTEEVFIATLGNEGDVISASLLSVFTKSEHTGRGEVATHLLDNRESRTSTWTLDKRIEARSAGHFRWFPD